MTNSSIAEALFEAHARRATGWLRCIAQGREAKLGLRDGALVAMELGFGFQAPAQALLQAGQLELEQLDALWVRGEVGELDAETLAELGVESEQVSRAQAVVGVRRLVELSEDSRFEAAEVSGALLLAGADLVRTAWEALGTPEGEAPYFRVTAPEALSAWELSDDDRAWLLSSDSLRSADDASAARRSLVELLARGGAVERIPAEEYRRQQEEERERHEAEEKARREEEERLRLEAEEKARREEEERLRLEAEEKARQEEEERLRQEAEEKARQEEEERLRQEAEEKARQEEEERLRQEAEEKARREEEERLRLEAEEKARREEEERLRLEAEEKARREEEERLRLEAEEKARREEEERLRLEAEEKARQEEERLRLEAEEKARREEEERLRLEAEEKARREEEERLRLEAEEKARQEEEERLRLEAEEKARQEEEERLRLEAEEKARQEEERLRLEAEEKARREEEERLRLEAEEKARQEEERLRLEAEEKARQEEEERLRLEAEEKARQEEEERLRLEAEEKARQEEERLRLEAQEKARQEEEERLRLEAEEKARQEEEERLRLEAEEKARQEEEERLRLEAEEKARREEEERLRLEAEEQARAADAARLAAEADASREEEERARRQALLRDEEAARVADEEAAWEREEAELLERARLAREAEEARRAADAEAEAEAQKRTLESQRLAETVVGPAPAERQKSLLERMNEALRQSAIGLTPGAGRGEAQVPAPKSTPQPVRSGESRAPLLLGRQGADDASEADLWTLVEPAGVDKPAPGTVKSFEEALKRVDSSLEALVGEQLPPGEEPIIEAVIDEDAPAAHHSVPLQLEDVDVGDSSDSTEAARRRRQRLLRRAMENLGSMPQLSRPEGAVVTNPDASPSGVSVSSSPSGISSAPSGITSAPSGIAATPSGITSAPSGISSSPSGLYSPEEEAALAREIESRFAAIGPRDHFVTLGLAPSATRDQVKSAFLTLAKRFHPDRLPPSLSHLAQKMSAVFESIRDAYETLYDEQKRAIWVASRAKPEAPPVPTGASFLKAAEIFFRKRDYREAEANYLKAHEIDKDANSLAAAAWAIYMDPSRRAEAGQARAMMQRALAIEPGCERANYQLGVISRVEGDMEAAERFFREALRTNPRHLEANQEVRLIEMRRKKSSRSGLFRG